MLGSKSAIVIVFVDRNRLQFYGGGLPSILALDLPPAVVRDLEIENRDALYTLVNQWMKQNNLGGAQLFFLLSPQTYFEKSITATGESEQETEILAFYDSVPFEELSTKVYAIDNKKWAIATNKDFIEAIRHAFVLQGMRIIYVVPAFLLGALASKRWLDAEMGSYVLKHIEAFRGQNIIDLDEPQSMIRTVSPGGATSKNNPRLMLMVGILGVLLLVLIFFAFMHR